MICHKGIELCCTNFNHPTITTGMHHNGKCTVWIRKLDGEWVCTYESQMHKVQKAIDELGDEVIEYYQLIELDHQKFVSSLEKA